MINDKSADRNEQGDLDYAQHAVRIPSVGASHSLRKRIRVRKEDSAFVYFVLESHEGITAYSTLEFKPGDAHRDLMLFIPPDFESEAEAVLKSLGEMIYELERDGT